MNHLGLFILGETREAFQLYVNTLNSNTVRYRYCTSIVRTWLKGVI